MWLTGSFLVGALLGVATVLGLVYYYMTVTFDFWKKKGIPFIQPTFFYGNLREQITFKKSLYYVLQDIYNKFPNERFCGYFESRTPVLMIRDPVLAERILIKDFSYFVDRDFPADMKRDPLSGNLFSLRGDVWRNLRNKLTPTFTTGKLKGMLEQICKSGDDLLSEIEKNTKSNKAADLKKLCSAFTIDIIASCAFGLQFRPNSPEGKRFREMIDLMSAPSSSRMLKRFLFLFIEPFAKFLGMTQFPEAVNTYFIELVKETMDFREKNNIQRSDFLQLMMDLKVQEAEGKDLSWKKELTEEDAYLNQMDYTPKQGQQELEIKVMTDKCIAAQSFVFLTAGSEATANALVYNFFELANNLQIQKRLQQEVDSVLEQHGGKITYESLKQMTYLDLIVQETNRRYSLGAFLRRVCTTPYTIPDSGIVIEKGTKVLIPLLAIHNDPVNYPEPEKFIPERFEGNHHRSNGGTFLPFGDGPRICIAMRFVIFEVKACLATVMSKYTISLDPRTQVPPHFDPKSFSLTPQGGIWVKFQQRMHN
uniref:Cytochrome P450 n=1 Tax=Homalodisca liturata TaxID=320908 RepID=A0A1B6H802_9HEMI